MSDKCSNCDCSDSSQCTKKGNTLVIETEKISKKGNTLVIVTEEISYVDAVAVDGPAAEHDGNCKSGSSGALA